MTDFVRITPQNFQQEVLQSSLPVLLEFGAAWCGPCKRLEPILQQLGDAWQGRMRIAKLDVDECSDLAVQFQVMSVPTVLLFVGGQPAQRVHGLQTRERLVEKFSPYLGE